jgi:hypothetical protein
VVIIGEIGELIRGVSQCEVQDVDGVGLGGIHGVEPAEKVLFDLGEIPSRIGPIVPVIPEGGNGSQERGQNRVYRIYSL